MTSFIKKNWFVSLVMLAFVIISIYYIYDTNKGKLKGKQSDGVDVVYSLGNEDTTVAKFYDDLYKSSGASMMATMFRNIVADQAIETTAEMKDNAAAQSTSIVSQYRSEYGTDYAARLASDLAGTGYTDLEEYLITAQKFDQLCADYAKANFDALSIRQISYILIQPEETDATETEAPVEAEETTETEETEETTETEEAVETEETEETTETEAATPTQDEQDRMDAVDEFLKTGTFADAAAEYSEDSSTASEGGVLGIIDANTSNLDAAFLEAALALDEGEVSDWVYSEQFGYFKIMCNAATPETLESLYTESDPYQELTTNYDTTLSGKAVWAKAAELGIDYHGNDDLEESIKNSLGLTEEE